MLTLDLDAPPLSCIGTAEDTYYLDVYLDEQPIAEELAQLVGLNAVHASPILGPDRYQLFFLGNENARTARLPDLLQRLLYRADLPADPQYMAISFPSQMNRRPENAAAVGPYVSALVGQQDYVENVCVLSAIQVLAAMARLRSTRRIAFAAITTLRQLEGQPHLRHERRRELVELSKRLSRLELELSFSVESVQDYSLLVPSLRLDDFHATLCVETRLDRRTQTTSEMVGRLSRALDAELAAMQSADAIMSERRRRTLTSAAGFISFLAIPLGIIFGFFGMAVREVDPTTSMFDFVVYAPLYAFVGGVLLAGGAVALWSWLGLTHRVFGPRPADT